MAPHELTVGAPQIRNKTLISAPLSRSKKEDIANIAVLQSLADHDPDIDGVYRLTQELPLKFDPIADGLILGRGIQAPWNAQAVLLSEAAFFTMLLPVTVHGRVTDIWR